MRTILILLISLSQVKSNLATPEFPFDFPTATHAKGSKWKESLAKFRTALLQGDKKTVKSFFEFPIHDPGNDIWLVADTRYATKIDSKSIVPFNESDFDTHYSAIFSLDFRKTFEKIDFEKLSNDAKAETVDLKIAPPATSKMRATYSEAEELIKLSLITKSPEFGQFTIDYHFKITPSGDLRFKETNFDM